MSGGQCIGQMRFDTQPEEANSFRITCSWPYASSTFMVSRHAVHVARCNSPKWRPCPLGSVTRLSRLIEHDEKACGMVFSLAARAEARRGGLAIPGKGPWCNKQTSTTTLCRWHSFA
jgi:hypothetical protein